MRVISARAGSSTKSTACTHRIQFQCLCIWASAREIRLDRLSVMLNMCLILWRAD